MTGSQHFRVYNPDNKGPYFQKHMFWEYTSGLPGISFFYGRMNKRSRVAYIHMIEVKKDARRHGLGRRALQALEVFLSSIGAVRISGWAVEGSESFWTAMGYEVVNTGHALPQISKRLAEVSRNANSTRTTYSVSRASKQSSHKRKAISSLGEARG